MIVSSSVEPTTAPTADDHIGRNDRAALVCSDEPTLREFLADQLRRGGYKVQTAADTATAAERAAGRRYHVIAVPDYFEGCQDLARHAWLQHLNEVSTDERLGRFVVLISQSLPTGDPVAAYGLSVDWVVNFNDLNRWPELFGPAYEEYEADNHLARALQHPPEPAAAPHRK